MRAIFGVLFLFALAGFAGCSSSNNDATCCNVTSEGTSICLCASGSENGASWSVSGGSGDSCTITASDQGTTETISGTVASSCTTAVSGFDGGGYTYDAGTICGYTGESCCTTGTPCEAGCCDPTTNICLYSGETCSDGNSVCSGTSCQACGGVGEACCVGNECTGGCCDSNGVAGTCVGTGQSCTSEGSDEVCASTGFCSICGLDEEPCCPGNTCTETDTVCQLVGTSGTCTLCGASGEPCCAQAPQCDTGTCSGGNCP